MFSCSVDFKYDDRKVSWDSNPWTAMDYREAIVTATCTLKQPIATNYSIVLKNARISTPDEDRPWSALATTKTILGRQLETATIMNGLIAKLSNTCFD